MNSTNIIYNFTQWILVLNENQKFFGSTKLYPISNNKFNKLSNSEIIELFQILNVLDDIYISKINTIAKIDRLNYAYLNNEFHIVTRFESPILFNNVEFKDIEFGHNFQFTEFTIQNGVHSAILDIFKSQDYKLDPIKSIKECVDLKNIIESDENSIIKDFIYWTLKLHSNQGYLGRCVLVCKRVNAEVLTDATIEEINELFKIFESLEKSLCELFKIDGIDYASLGNDFKHLHFHIIPRYIENITKHDSVFYGEPLTTQYKTKKIHTYDYDTFLKIKNDIIKTIS